MGERVKFSDHLDYSTGSGEYISAVNRFKLKKSSNGQLIHVCEEPYMYYRHYVDDAPISRVYYNCCKPDSDNCPLCADGNSRTPRFVMNVLEYIHDEDTDKVKIKVKIWDVSSKIMKQLQEIEKEFGNLLNFDLKITCDSEQFQSIGLIVPKANEKIKSKIEKLKEENKLHKLDSYSKCMSPAEMKKALGLDSADDENEEDTIEISDEDNKSKKDKKEKKEVKEEKKKKIEEDDDDIEIDVKKDDDSDEDSDKKSDKKKKEEKKKSEDDDENLDEFFKDDEDDK